MKYHQSVKEIYFLADHVTYGNTQVARLEKIIYNLFVSFYMATFLISGLFYALHDLRSLIRLSK